MIIIEPIGAPSRFGVIITWDSLITGRAAHGELITTRARIHAGRRQRFTRG